MLLVVIHEKFFKGDGSLKDNIDKLNSGIFNIVTDERNDAGIL